MEVTVLVPTDRVADAYRAIADVIQPPPEPEPEPKRTRKSHGMSPEHRAAAAERMRNMQAKLRAGREAARA